MNKNRAICKPVLVFCCASIVTAIATKTAIAEPTDSESLPQNDRPVILKRHTLKQIRDRNIIKQQLDYSCGAAALATLMVHYFGEDTSEQEILDLLNVRMKDLSEEEVARKRRAGFSLLDLKIVAQQKGFQAAGFRLSLPQLMQLTVPVIVFVRPLGYHHFAVLRGTAGNRVFLADPSRGNLSMSISRFLDEYGGVVFVLGRTGEEDINSFPLELGQSGDYARPDGNDLIEGINHFRAYNTNLAVRARPR